MLFFTHRQLWGILWAKMRCFCTHLTIGEGMGAFLRIILAQNYAHHSGPLFLYIHNIWLSSSSQLLIFLANQNQTKSKPNQTNPHTGSVEQPNAANRFDEEMLCKCFDKCSKALAINTG